MVVASPMSCGIYMEYRNNQMPTQIFKIRVDKEGGDNKILIQLLKAS